jgi:hypothetical protein
MALSHTTSSWEQLSGSFGDVAAMDTYFECITTCSLDDGECVTRCVEHLRSH